MRKPFENSCRCATARASCIYVVENNGTILHWVKVKGHSGDIINDKADELATDGMHNNKPPRQLKYKQIVSRHYDKAEERRQATMRATEQDE